MTRKHTIHSRLRMPKLDGSKKAKQAYNKAYWLKVASKRRNKK